MRRRRRLPRQLLTVHLMLRLFRRRPRLAKRIVDEIANVTDQLRNIRKDLLGKELNQSKVANILCTVEENLAGNTEELLPPRISHVRNQRRFTSTRQMYFRR